MWGDALVSPFLCSEDAHRHPSLTTPGGDVAEWALAMHAYESLLMDRIDDHGELTVDNSPITVSLPYIILPFLTDRE